MARIRQQERFDARRDGFLDVAWALMLEGGYEALSVNRLIARAESSKGAFYHYFSSRDEVVDAAVERIVRQTLADIEDTAAREAPALEKLDRFLGVSGVRPPATGALRQLLVQVHRSGNEALVDLLVERAWSLCLPPLERIIEQGIEEGRFDTPFPAEAAELILAASKAALLDSVRMLTDASDPKPTVRLLLRRTEATIHAAERLLGLERNTLARLTAADAEKIAAGARPS